MTDELNYTLLNEEEGQENTEGGSEEESTDDAPAEATM